MVIIYALCDNTKSIEGYGVFDGSDIQEFNIEDTSVLIQTKEIRNAEVKDGVINIINCTSVLPTFYKNTYEPLYRHSPIYVVCRCTQKGVEGYLILNPMCMLQFVSRDELVAICKKYIVTNVRLQKLKKSKRMFPVPNKILFKNIGKVELG